MRSSSVLPSEHVVALSLNLLVVAAAMGSAFHLMPALFANSAKSRLIDQELRGAQSRVKVLEAQVSIDSTARSQANLVPNSRVSVLWSPN